MFLKLNKLLNNKTALFLCLLVYLYILLSTYSSSYFPGGLDSSTHLFQIWLFQEEGFTSWNHWWYAGNPQLDQYPPLSHYIPSLFSPYLGVEVAYKLIFSIFFLLLPLSFYLLLKEISLSDDQKAISLYFFSFSVVFIHFFQGGVFAALFSVPLAILFIKYLLNFLNSGTIRSAALSSVFLALTALSHLFVPVAIILLSFIYLFSCFVIITKIKDLTKENLMKNKYKLKRNEYYKLLRRWQGIIESKLISMAERGLPRNKELEELLRLIEDEKKRVKK